MIRISKRKPELQKSAVEAGQDLRQREEDAQASAAKRPSLPAPPKKDDAVDPANALVETVPNPLNGQETAPSGMDQNADAHR